MSSLWTPGGERPVGRDPQPEAPTPPPPPPGPGDYAEEPLSEAEVEARMAELRDQLARTPVESVVAQVAYQLFEVGALHLSLQPPQLEQAQMAIDAMAALVDGLAGRLGENEPQLRDGLSQIRMAFVQIQRGASTPPPPTDPEGQAPPQS